MRYQIILILLFSIFIISCGGTTEITKNNNNSVNGNSNTPKNSNNGLVTNKPQETAKVDDATSIKPTIEGFYASLQKKDEAGAKKYLSVAALKYWEDEAKAEKKSWFTYLLEMEDPINEKREVRNEKIQGDKATAEMKGGPLGTWTSIAFVKESGEWKFDSPAVSHSNIDIQRTEPSLSKGK